MQRILFWTMSTVAVAVGASTATQLLGQGAQGEPRQQGEAQHALPATLPGPIVSTHELMELFNQPLYEFLRKEMQKELGDETEWDTIADRGLQTAEVMNLVAIRQEREGQEQAWMKLARGVQEAGLALNAAAKQHDVEQTRNTYRALIQNCNACHQEMAPDHAPQLQP